MERYESLQHTKRECKSPSGLDSEMPEESSIRTTSEGSGVHPSKVGIAERE